MGRDPAVLITGGDGQVGRALRALLPNARAPGHDDLDITDRAALVEALDGVQSVVHLAAFTDVDGCEADPARAARVNLGGTDNVIAAARTRGAKVIYLSTDYVFGGSSSEPYTESDAPSPLNVYGSTKLGGERAVASQPTSLIVRSSWIFGEGHNFVATILRAARSGRELRIVDDQRGVPTHSDAVARALEFSLRTDLQGLVHVCGEGPIVTWAGLAQAALDIAGLDVKIRPVTTERYAADASRVVAARPAFSALDASKARSLGVPLLDWRSSLDAYIGAGA